MRRRGRSPRPGRSPRRGDGRRGGLPARPRGAAVAVLLLLLAVGGCDDIVKVIPVFADMVDRPGIVAYEEQPREPAEGSVPVDGEPDPTLDEADERLENPLAGTEDELARGRRMYSEFCLPCHGEAGDGEGPVVNYDDRTPARLPFVPALDLTAGTGPERSDGYIWGIIGSGRGLMPEYRRIPREDRWAIVLHVRELQRGAAGDTGQGEGAAGGAGDGETTSGGAGGEGAAADAEDGAAADAGEREAADAGQAAGRP